MFFFLVCLFTTVFGEEVYLSFGGDGKIKCQGKTKFSFHLDEILIKNVADNLVSLKIPGRPNRLFKGEPELPVIREFVALPHTGEWKIVVTNITTITHELNGSRVIPSKGPLLLKQNPSEIPFEFSNGYAQPLELATGFLYPSHTMRDVHGTILEINPVFYDPTVGILEIMTSCNIQLISLSEPTDGITGKIVDATFYDLYSFHYINFHHYAGKTFIKGDNLGRMIVFYADQFKDSATKFATWKKTLLKDVILAPCSGSASSLKSLIKKYYDQSDSLTYAVLFGTSCPTFNCQESRKECDVQYAQMSSDSDDVTLDVFVSRIAVSSQADVDAQMDKFQSYSKDRNYTDWEHETAGLALNLIGDEYQFMHRNLNKMKDFGFTKATFMTDDSATSAEVVQDWNQGMGIYFYIGHGSGTAWNCPQRTGGMTERDIQSDLHNDKLYPFILECSCLNGGFKSHNPCFAQAMMSKNHGGAISMYSSAPEAQSSSPKDLQSGAVDALTSKKATRVGPIYYAGIMYAYKLHPRQALYTLQGYNMFGDPSIQLNFLK